MNIIERNQANITVKNGAPQIVAQSDVLNFINTVDPRALKPIVSALMSRFPGGVWYRVQWPDALALTDFWQVDGSDFDEILTGEIEKLGVLPSEICCGLYDGGAAL